MRTNNVQQLVQLITGILLILGLQKLFLSRTKLSASTLQLETKLQEGSLFHTAHHPYRDETKTKVKIASTRQTVYTYCDNVEDLVLVRQWKIAMFAAGFNPQVLNLKHATESTHYNEFVIANANSSTYIEKHRRWFAFLQVGGGWYLDYSIIPLYAYSDLVSLHQLQQGQFQKSAPTTYRFAPFEALYCANVTQLEPFVTGLIEGESDDSLLKHVYLRKNEDIFVHYSRSNIERISGVSNLTSYETAQLISYHMHMEFLATFKTIRYVGRSGIAQQYAKTLATCPQNYSLAHSCPPSVENVDLGRRHCQCHSLPVTGTDSLDLTDRMFNVVSISPPSAKSSSDETSIKGATRKALPKGITVNSRELLCKDLIYLSLPYSCTLWIPMNRLPDAKWDPVYDIGFNVTETSESYGDDTKISHSFLGSKSLSSFTHSKLWQFANDIASQKVELMTV